MPGPPANTTKQRILSLLGQYFAVINAHDYQGYLALLSPQAQQGWTAAAFAGGFQATQDSGQTLTGISTAADGRTVAAVTFTSHQAPSASVNDSQSCTIWHILLFLEPACNGYLIGDPPPGYTASYAACS